MSGDNLENHQVPTWRNEMHNKNVTSGCLDAETCLGFFSLYGWFFFANIRVISCQCPLQNLHVGKKRRKKSYIPVSFLPTIKRCVQDIILGFQMFHRGRSSDKMTIRFSLISSVSKNITSTLLHWYFALWGNIFHIIAWDIGTTSNSWYIGNGQLELTCRAHRKLVPKYG